MGAVRYRSRFESLAGRKYQVNIWDTDWEGSASDFCLGPEGFELSYEGSTDDMYKPFIPSRLEFKFNVANQTAEGFIIDLAQSEPSKFRIFITESPASGDGDESLFWQGFVQGEGVTIADEFYPYEVNLSAGDIGFFKDVDYTPASGESTIVDTLLAVLEQTDHAAFVTDGAHAYDEMLVTTMNWWGVYMASGGDPSDKVAINERAWTDYDKANAPLFANCQDVVESICKLFGCRFFQSRGKFYLQQIDAVGDGSTREWVYDLSKTLVSDNFETKTKEVDRVDLYQMAGGSTTFAPGLKSVEREHRFTRNYLAGKYGDQANPLNLSIGAVPVFNYIISSIVPRFQLKFKVIYRMLKPLTGAEWQAYPVWRMNFGGEGATDGETWNYRRDLVSWLELYITANDTFKMLQEFKRQPSDFTGWVTSTDSGNALYDPTYYWFDTWDRDAYQLNAALGGGYTGNEQSFEVAVDIPRFGDPLAAAQNIVDLLLSFDIYGIYGTVLGDLYTPLRKNLDTDPGFNFDEYVTWRIDEMELYILGDEPEAKIETGKKYKVESATNFRKKTEADSCKLIAFDRRTLNSVLTWNGSFYTDSQLWQRGAWNITDSRSLNYLSIQEILAHNRIGMRMYQGALLQLENEQVYYESIVEKGGIKYLPLQATFNALNDEWRNLNMMELERDASGLAYSVVVSEGGSAGGAGNGQSVTGGYVVVGGGQASGVNPNAVLPAYEFASGQSGSTYTMSVIDAAALSGAPDGLVNQSLWVFQDSTKLNYPIGYTVDWANNEITFNYDLEDATLEIYYYG